MQRSSFAAQDRIAVCSLPTRYVRRASEIGFDTDELLDQLRSIDGIDVVVLLKERDDGTVKFSLRASERVDVDAIARTFGGGGHRKAAGGEVAGSLEVVREQVVGKVAEALEAITVPDVAG
jgi:phosphoesterase RecJ-like protein